MPLLKDLTGHCRTNQPTNRCLIVKEVKFLDVLASLGSIMESHSSVIHVFEIMSTNT